MIDAMMRNIAEYPEMLKGNPMRRFPFDLAYAYDYYFYFTKGKAGNGNL